MASQRMANALSAAGRRLRDRADPSGAFQASLLPRVARFMGHAAGIHRDVGKPYSRTLPATVFRVWQCAKKRAASTPRDDVLVCDICGTDHAEGLSICAVAETTSASKSATN
jgi:hypothetical protein